MTHVERLVSVLSGDRVYIQTHNFPDADAIACAYGLRILLKKYGIRATIVYRKKQDSYTIEKLIEKMNINISEKVDEMGDENLPDDAEIIIVDSQLVNSNVTGLGGKYVACIDHHPLASDGTEYGYFDVQPEYGACSTIIAEYFLEEMVPFHKKTATLLTYGIRTDTANLSRGVCKKDIAMLCELYDMTDYQLIRHLENSILYYRDLYIYDRAIKDTVLKHNISFTSTGVNCSDLVLSQICDMMLSAVEIDVAAVCTIRGNGVKLSVRSVIGRVDAGKLIRKALEGLGSGGGHASMAGGFVPYQNGISTSELIRDIQTRFFREAHRHIGVM